jgi:hypothetical protein
MNMVPRRQWIPCLVAIQALLAAGAWLLLGGVFAVVMTFIFCVGWVLGLVPLSPRR